MPPEIGNRKPNSPPYNKASQNSTPRPHIFEDQLWQALLDYRQAQNRTHLVKGRITLRLRQKRVEEHQTRYLTLKADEKPFDSHA